jgi:hypothetical protein
MIRIMALVAATSCIVAGIAAAQEPAYAHGQGPVVLLDVAHHNLGPPQRWVSLTRFLEDDGFRVRVLEDPFDADALDGVQIAIVSGALSARNALPDEWTQEEFEQAWRLPTPSAFVPAEITVLSEWVAIGGAILLVLDHMPLAGAGQDLAESFGIEVSNGYAVDEAILGDLSPPSVAQAGSVVFRRAEGTLTQHPITNGRNSAERVDSVATFVGSAFRLPSRGQSLLTLGTSFVSLLPDVAWVFSAATPRMPIGGWSQGGALRVGQGRLVVFGELGTLVTPDMVAGDTADADNPQMQNPKLLLNALHWLSGLLDER